MSFTYSTVPSPPIFGKKQKQGITPTNNQVPSYVSANDQFEPLSISSILPSNVALKDAENIFTQKNTFNEDVILQETKKLFLDGGVNTYIQKTSAIDISVFLNNFISQKITNSIFDFYSESSASIPTVRMIKPDNTVNSIMGQYQINGYDSLSILRTLSIMRTHLRTSNVFATMDSETIFFVVRDGVLTDFLAIQGNNDQIVSMFPLNMNAKRITNIGAPTLDTDGARKLDTNHLIFTPSNIVFNFGLTRYIPLFSSAQSNTVETSADLPITYAFVIRRFRASVLANSLNGSSTLGFRDDGVTVASVTVGAGATGEFDSGILAVNVVGGSKCNKIIVTGGTSGTLDTSIMSCEVTS